MQTYLLENFSFTYPGRQRPALASLNLSIDSGQFVTICGPSGSGKTTLLRQLKTVLAPHGTNCGQILFEGRPIDTISQQLQATQIGFVQQSPDNQLVTDKVWHELAFGLESLGADSKTIRLRVAEMATFFGIEHWFNQDVNQLSGGQKQLLNLAAVMTMQPSILVLDEPTAQLDPISAQDFLETLSKINREMGMTILISEHRLEAVLPLSDRVIVLDSGAIVTDGPPKIVAERLKQLDHPMFLAMPTPMRVWAAVDNDLSCPLTVREGRDWLTQFAAVCPLDPSVIPDDKIYPCEGQPVISIKEISFRYAQDGQDVLRNFSLDIFPGEFLALLGGNATGKSTLISLIAGINAPHRGKIIVEGRTIHERSRNRDCFSGLAVLPQNPQTLFVKKTVKEDLFEVFSGRGIDFYDQEKRVMSVARLCQLEHLLASHPYDLSLGEQQRAALAKVLLLAPRILLLDEPTKGLDSYFKQRLANILLTLRQQGMTILMVSHDIEFCAQNARRCAMLFDGAIVAEQTPRRFFAGQHFYTTIANRMGRRLLPAPVLAEDIIAACGGVNQTPDIPSPTEDIRQLLAPLKQAEPVKKKIDPSLPKKIKEPLTPKRLVFGIVMIVLFILTAIFGFDRWTDWRMYLLEAAVGLEAVLALIAFFPGKPLISNDNGESLPGVNAKRRISPRTWLALALILGLMPLTIWVGLSFFDDRKYFFISLMIVVEALLPFILVFEGRKPQARELVIIAVLIAIAVAGRTLLILIPEFKPVIALVIITGICFGGEAGFLVGAMTAFLSNFFMGQGPWTPWQMFAFGLIGFIAGVLSRRGLLPKRRGPLCLFGGLSALVIYGGILNISSALIFYSQPTWEILLVAYGLGLPFDLAHAAATMFFLWVIAGPLIEKLERIKRKYGLLE